MPNGRKDRTMVLVDIRETPERQGRRHLPPGPARQGLRGPHHAARARSRASAVDPELVAETGLTLEQLQDFADRMKKAQFGVLFFGMGLSMTRGKHMNSAALLTLAAELNAFTKFVAMPMRGHGNVTGGDVVMRWTTGYPFGVNLCRGYPRFNPGEFSTVDLLIRGDMRRGAGPRRRPGRDDAAAGHRPPGPHPDHRAGPQGDAHQPAGPRPHHHGGHGHQRPGTVYRMDEIPLPLRPALKSPYPTDEEVIRRIYQAVAAKPPLVPPVCRTCDADDSDESDSTDRAVQSVSTVQRVRTSCTGTPCFGSRAARSTTPPTASTARSRTSASRDGRIVADVEGGRTIDATGMVVFPGGVDVHTHVAGAAPQLRPRHDPGGPPPQRPVRPHRRCAAAASAAPRPPPSSPATSTPAWARRPSTRRPCPILSARHTHEELRDTPIVDKSCCVLMANNEILLDLIEAGELERARHVVAWNIWAAKAYGVKAVNPGGVAAWKWGKDAKGLSRADRTATAR